MHVNLAGVFVYRKQLRTHHTSRLYESGTCILNVDYSKVGLRKFNVRTPSHDIIRFQLQENK